MGETNPRVLSMAQFKCHGAYLDQHRVDALVSAQMIVYDNGEHLTDCDSIGDGGICRFGRENYSARPCPFIHDR